MQHGQVIFHPIVRIIHYICEYFGTLIFMTALILSITFFVGSPIGEKYLEHDFLKTIGVLIPTILVILALIYSPFGKISGAHLNPSLTFAFWMEGLVDTLDAIFYTIAQVLAAITACIIVAFFFPTYVEVIGSGRTQPLVSIYPELISFLVEMLMTGILVSIVFTFQHHKDWVKYTGLTVCSYLFLSGLIISPLVGLSMNPARSLGPAIATGVYDYVWIYLAGPLLGSFISVHLHRISDLLKRPKYFRLYHQEGYLEKLFEKYIIHLSIDSETTGNKLGDQA